MFTLENRKLFQRFFILGVLVACLGILSSTDLTEKVYACKLCMECADAFVGCVEAEQCNGDATCIQQCKNTARSCWRGCCIKTFTVDYSNVNTGGPQHYCCFTNDPNQPPGGSCYWSYGSCCFGGASSCDAP